MVKEKSSSSVERLVPVLVIVSVILAFAVGALWQRIEVLEGAKSLAVADQAQGANNQAAAPREQLNGKLSDAQAGKLVKVSSADHIRGNADAKVVIVEYSDFECPFCSNFHETAKQAFEKYNGDVAWVYRHFPLDQIHPKAREVAEASECVANLGGKEAFWKFADEVFANEENIADLSGVATKIGVNSFAFESCLESGEFKDLVQAQYEAGINAGVTGTPGNFLVNKKGEVWFVPGAVPLIQLESMIDEALNS